MSLQLRIIGSIAALLLLTLLAGAALLSLHARDSVAREVETAFRGAERSVGDTLKSDVQHTVTMRQVVASFQGQRHVRAALVNEEGTVIVQSEIAPVENPAPVWFARTMMPPTTTARIPIALPGFPCTVVLTSDPRSEIADVWHHARDAFRIMLFFCLAAMVVAVLAINTALRFLRNVEAGLLAISKGRYDTRLKIEGPPEFAGLARDFNHMAGRLDGFSRANRQLYSQLQSVQEEERASIARDLHDEVGPYLFAIQVDAKAVAALDNDEARTLGGSIRETVGHIQQHVQALIRQLRPVSQLEFGLNAAIADIIAFWKRRHPGIVFTVDAPIPDRLPASCEEAAFRIVQESVSNAVRHGAPSRIVVSLRAEAGELAITVEDDGKGGPPEPGNVASLGGTGIAGMRERIAALYGRFEITRGAGGTQVRATLPLAPAREPA
jgi:two-component system sensor histidine kinase UhpB